MHRGEIQALWREDQKVQAVKELRAITGVGVATAVASLRKVAQSEALNAIRAEGEAHLLAEARAHGQAEVDPRPTEFELILAMAKAIADVALVVEELAERAVRCHDGDTTVARDAYEAKEAATEIVRILEEK